MHLVKEPFTLEYISLREPLHSEPLPEILSPLAFVSVSVSILHDSLALFAAHDPLAVVYSPISIQHFAKAMRQMLLPLTLIHISVLEPYGADA